MSEKNFFCLSKSFYLNKYSILLIFYIEFTFERCCFVLLILCGVYGNCIEFSHDS